MAMSISGSSSASSFVEGGGAWVVGSEVLVAGGVAMLNVGVMTVRGVGW